MYISLLSANLLFIIRWDSQLLIRPCWSVRPWEMTLKRHLAKCLVVCLLWKSSICIPMLIYFDAVPTHQYGVRVVPHVPQDPEPHGATEQLCLKLLVLGELRRLSVLGFNMRASSCPKTWPSERLPVCMSNAMASSANEKRWY